MSSDEDQMAHPASQMQEQLLTEAAVLRITAEETVGETPVLEVLRETPRPERDVKIENMSGSAEDTPRVTSQTLPTPAVPAPRVATDEAEVPAKPRKKRHRSKKKDAANTAVLDSRVSQKNTKSQVNDLVTQLEGLSISSRNSTPTRSLGGTKSKLTLRSGPKAKSKNFPTRRAENSRSARDGPSIYGDGTFLFIKTPKELRERQPKIPTRDMLTAIRSGGIDLQSLLHAEPVQDGWRLQATDVAAAQTARGKTFRFDSYKLRIDIYHTGGTRVFLTNHAGPFARNHRLLAVAIASVFPQKKFWLGYHEVLGIQAAQVVVVFEESPGSAGFHVPIGPKPQGFSKQFIGRFLPMDFSGVCILCKGNHAFDCPELVPVVLSGEKDLEYLLQTRPSIS